MVFSANLKLNTIDDIKFLRSTDEYSKEQHKSHWDMPVTVTSNSPISYYYYSVIHLGSGMQGGGAILIGTSTIAILELSWRDSWETTSENIKYPNITNYKVAIITALMSDTDSRDAERRLRERKEHGLDSPTGARIARFGFLSTGFMPLDACD